MLSHEIPVPGMFGGVGLLTVKSIHPCPCVVCFPHPQLLNRFAKTCCAVGCTVLTGGVAALVAATTTDLPAATKNGLYGAAAASFFCSICICLSSANTYRSAHNTISGYMAAHRANTFDDLDRPLV